MAPPRIFDQRSFKGQGALISARALFGGLTRPPIDLSDRPLLVFLRWQSNPRIGMPVEPFRVWRRPATRVEEPEIEVERIALPPLGRVVVLPEPMVSVSLAIGAGPGPAAGHLVPLADGIGFDGALAFLPYALPAGGTSVIRFQASYITAIVVVGGAEVTAVTGLPLAAASKIEGWEPVETVGLPVDEGQWSDLAGQRHGVKQGRVGAELPAPDAAADRMSRGIAPFGWHQAFPAGQPAPAWDLPGAADLIADADVTLLPLLHEAMALPPGDQAGFTREIRIDPPQNPAGKQMPAAPGTASVSPLTLLQLAVATDPLQAVTLGYGTGFPYEDIPAIHLGAASLFDDKGVSDWDFMVTGVWNRRGGDAGAGTEVEFAALIPRPRLVLPPPAPADLALDFLGHHQPPVPDGPWSAALRLSWERLALDNLTRVASFAAARSDLARPGVPAEALMERRAEAPGHNFIGDARNPDDPEQVRQSASDSGFAIPNDPGSVAAVYGVATQNIFGIWSPWVTVPFSSAQPAPEAVALIDAALVPVDPGPPASVCSAELRIEFVVDWRARRVASVGFRGRLFAAATRDADPPGGVPAALQTSLAGATRSLVVTFAGDVPGAAGATVTALDAQGSAVVAPGPAQGQSRRYRLVVPGFALDFAGTPHVGLALEARLQESLAPGRIGPWSPVRRAYASDPRARPAPPLPTVPLASLPDAAGACHARLAWTPLPGAAGYVVYESNEFVLLDRTGQPRAAPGATLSERLVAMKAAFDAQPDRNAFTRLNDAPLSVTSLDATLPRGSQAICCWVVLALGAGGIEGPWPGTPVPSDALIVYAAPKIAAPAPPRIEVRRIAQGAGFAARLRVETRPAAGARPARLRLYRTRVADAARTIDSMGPPVAEIAGSAGPWVTDPPAPAAGGWIGTATGTDAPDGSWKQVWYRAEALADPLPERGVLGGRSPASPAVAVVVPPAGPPPLSALSLSWPGGAPGDVLARFTSAAPVPDTPLGAHVLEVEALEQGQGAALLRLRLPLSAVAGSAPAAAAPGLWRPADGQYSLLLRRADAGAAASLSVRLTDPLGRASERVAAIAPGTLLPPPEMSPITSFAIAGRGRVYSFTLENVRDDAVNGQPWRIAIALTPQAVGPLPLPPVPGLPRPGRPPVAGPALPGPALPGPALPGPAFLGPAFPGPAARPGFGLGRPRRPQFTFADGVWTFAAPVADIPVSASDEPFTAIRQRLGDVLTIQILARERLQDVAATVTGPTGATATRRVRG